MISRLFAIIRKEFTHIFRDPRTLSIVLVMPISMLLLMGYAVATDIEDIPTAVFDQAMDPRSRDFLEKFWQTHFFELKRTAHNPQEIQDLIDEGVVRVGIIIWKRENKCRFRSSLTVPTPPSLKWLNLRPSP
jgi:ABC-2 type transport system permease protein